MLALAPLFEDPDAVNVEDKVCPDCGKRAFIPSPEAVAALVDQIPIPSELKASPLVLEERLALCASCDALREGVLCAFCGCFVRFRARPQKAYCPHPEGDKWILSKTHSKC